MCTIAGKAPFFNKYINDIEVIDGLEVWMTAFALGCRSAFTQGACDGSVGAVNWQRLELQTAYVCVCVLVIWWWLWWWHLTLQSGRLLSGTLRINNRNRNEAYAVVAGLSGIDVFLDGDKDRNRYPHRVKQGVGAEGGRWGGGGTGGCPRKPNKIPVPNPRRRSSVSCRQSAERRRDHHQIATSGDVEPKRAHRGPWCRRGDGGRGVPTGGRGARDRCVPSRVPCRR